MSSIKSTIPSISDTLLKANVNSLQRIEAKEEADSVQDMILAQLKMITLHLALINNEEIKVDDIE